MIAFFRSGLGPVVFLLLQQSVAAQDLLHISGDRFQPEICIRRQANDSLGPQLFWLSNNQASDIPVGGHYTYQGQECCFKPLYPLPPGERFLIRAAGYKDSILSMPDTKLQIPHQATSVVHSYPLGDSIPENILFFHVRFDQAMQEDLYAWQKIHLYTAQGDLIPRTWRQRSFWLDSGRLLVLMIHPGRVKHGIHYTGPVFSPGQQYSLSVDSTLADIYGRHIVPFVQPYYVKSEQRKKLQTCSISQSIRAGSRDTINIHFCSGIDHASALNGIKVYDTQGQHIDCSVQQTTDETILLIPYKPWPKGKLKLALTGSLYDVAGNRQHRLFEVKNKEEIIGDESMQWEAINAE